MRLLVAMMLVPMLASGGMCSKAEPEPEEETTAAERLQKGRNVYDGNVNQNLRELRQDLEAVGQERVVDQDQAIDRALERR
jgi:hypothetical protein